MPTQTDEYPVPVPETAGTVQSPLTAVIAPFWGEFKLVSTAYPAQLELVVATVGEAKSAAAAPDNSTRDSRMSKASRFFTNRRAFFMGVSSCSNEKE